jgi:hypothetical protein
MVNDQKIRAVLFYLCVAVFFTGLPMILSSALGYKFNPHTFKFTKTGLISIKTQPQGADVYLDGRLMDQKTPATINELLPGSYNIKIELKRHYPWSTFVNIEPRKVSRFEKIILFPSRPDIEQLNQERISHFWVDDNEGRIYYFNQNDSILYKSRLNGERFEEIGSIPREFSSLPRELKVSPDKQKALIFNEYQVCVFYLQAQGGFSYRQKPIVLSFPDKQINNVFWHSDSYHLILAADKSIEVLEAASNPNPVNLVSLNKMISSVFYDSGSDTLYFMDSEMAANGVYYDNAYKLDLGSEERPLSNLIKLRQNADK